MAVDRTGSIPARWRRLSQLGTPRQDVDYVLMNTIWRHGIVCRWDGRRWLTRAPHSLRGLDLEIRLGSLPMPTWFLELPSLLDQVQAEIDQARASARDLPVNFRTPLGTD